MSNEAERVSADPVKAAYLDGRRTGLAVAALAAGAVAFLSLLGIEKAVLAFVLAVLGLRGARSGSKAKRLSLLAMVIAGLYVLTFVVTLVLYHEKVAEILRLMQKLG